MCTHKLHNLILIIDRNKSDFRSIKFHNLKKKLSVFSNKIYEINGHNISSIDKAIKKCLKGKNFNIIIANTVKGSGVSFIENQISWHHKVPSKEEFEKANLELESRLKSYE